MGVWRAKRRNRWNE